AGGDHSSWFEISGKTWTTNTLEINLPLLASFGDSNTMNPLYQGLMFPGQAQGQGMPGMSMGMPGLQTGLMNSAAGQGQGMANQGMAMANPMANPMAGLGMAGMMMNPAALAIYQQYALRWAALQKFSAQAQATPMTAGPSMGQQRPSSGLPRGPGGEDPAVFYKTRICNKWREGTCPYPETCKYAHGEHELRTMSDNQAEGRGHVAPNPVVDKRASIQMMKKTRLCEEFMNTGSCKYGDRCTFAHGSNELRQPPNQSSFAAAQARPYTDRPGLNKEIHKTRLCERFMSTGACNYGSRCTFAHGSHELRKPGQAMPAHNQGTQEQQDISNHLASPDDQQYPAADSQLAGQQGFPGTAGMGDGSGSRYAHTASNGDLQHQHMQQQQPGEEGLAGLSPADGVVVGSKRGREEPGPQGYMAGGVAAGADALMLKKQHLDGEAEAEETGPEPDCALCARLVRTGRAKVSGTRLSLWPRAGPGIALGCRALAGPDQNGFPWCCQVLAGINALENPKARQLGAMIVAANQRLDQLWNKCTAGMVLGWMAKMQGLSIMDKIEVLKTVVFHVHPVEGCTRAEDGGLGLASQKYVDMGLPADCADFVYMALEGKEGSATMSEYFHMLEVCKQLFGIDDDNYYTVSTAVAGIMMGM
ncbi:hypothetical protein QJQ45_020276, partial [Haematococcus lacustris]